MASFISRCCRTGPTRRANAPRETTRSSRPPPQGIARFECRIRTARGEHFLLLHRRRVWNEGAEKMDRLGAQTRQVARIEPPVARRDRYEFRAPIAGRAPVVPTDVRYVITLDADTRLPRGTRRSAGRQDGAPAQPAAVRRRGRARGRGIWRAAAARDAFAADRHAKVRCSSASFPA